MDFEGYSLVRLSPDKLVKSFDCDDSDLNDFFINDSLKYLNQLLAVTYILENDTHTVAFFSLSNDKIDVLNSKSKSFWKSIIGRKLPHEKRRSYYPAVKLGRLGVHKDFQGKKIGTAIIDYIKQLFVTKNRTGCKFITLDAYNNKKAVEFYQKNGFDFLTDKDVNDNTRLMYFDLADVTP